MSIILLSIWFSEVLFVYGKNDFAEIPKVFKNLARYNSENNFIRLPKLFSDLYLAKFLNTLAKSFFPYEKLSGEFWDTLRK